MSRQIDFSRIAPSVVLAAAAMTAIACAALLTRVGSDAQWAAALGHIITGRGAIPRGVPFAATATGRWPNALVLAELIFAWLESALGDRGLMLAQLAAAGGGMAILARDARRGGAGEVGTGAALLLVCLGALPALSIVRVQLFSLLLFPALFTLVRSEARRPSRRIWLAVPLLALWSNLHGAALLGLGVLGAYLVLDRGRREPLRCVAVAAASILALGLTPALVRTGDYYHGVLTNVAAQRGQGMWSPLSLTSPLDLLLVVAAAVLVYKAWRGRAALWEWVVLTALVVLTIGADRDGVWLVMFAAGPAARALDPVWSLTRLTPIAAVASVAVIGISAWRGPVADGASPKLVRSAVATAAGSPILADGTIDEQVALAGGRIWAGNPIDAFPRSVQAAYLDWVAGAPTGRRALAPDVRVVLVDRESQTATLMAHTSGFVLAGGDATAVMYERTTG